MFLLGEYEVSIDDKGRIRLPSDLLRQLGKEGEGDSINMVLHLGMEKCLWAWREDIFEGLMTKLSRLNIFNSTQRQFSRFFSRGMTKASTDKAERILLRERLLEYAGLEKNGSAVLLCQGTRIEIWSPEVYYALFNDSLTEEFSEISNKVLGGGGEGGAEVEDMDLGDFFGSLATIGNTKTTEKQ